MLLWKAKVRIRELESRLFANTAPIKNILGFETPKRLTPQEALSSRSWKPRQSGWIWGRPWTSAWLRLRFEIPKAFAGKAVSLRVDTGGDAIVFRDGHPVQGLDAMRDELRLTGRAKGEERFDFLIEAGCRQTWGKSASRPRFSRAEICTVDRGVWECWHVLAFLRDLAEALPEGSTRRIKLTAAVNEAVDAFDFDNSDEEALSRSASAALAAVSGVRSRVAESSQPELCLVGQSHIDVAWLWPLRETIRKCARTFSTVDKYMEEYPEYKFSQSQAQLYAFVKERYPSLYRRIKQRVKEGRWEPVGGMWVEPDCNLISGESLVRQILYGQKYFEAEFGRRSKTVWLPDAFGFPASLPQIIVKSGMRNFMTQKIAVNDTNRFPFQAFRWRGIDGSEALAHIPSPSQEMTPQALLDSVRRFSERDRCDVGMKLFGYGDGGGGPAKDMLEFARTGADLEGCPRLAHTTADGYFERLERQAHRLPAWVGELYLEKHRGTYTTHGEAKRFNRRGEFLMREAEIASCIGLLDARPYPSERLLGLWHLLLLNQFHDIVPGTSIAEVHEESARQFRMVLSGAASVRDRSLKALAHGVDTRGEGEAVFVFNSLSWTRSSVAEAPMPSGVTNRVSVLDSSRQSVPCEIAGTGKQRRVRFLARDVPGIGYSVFHIVPETRIAASPKVKAKDRLLENPHLRVRFDESGFIRSIFDKTAKREIVPARNRANVFQLFEDRPLKNDAWDIFVYYLDKKPEMPVLESIRSASAGPVEAALCAIWRVGKSRIEQTIALGAGSRRIEFRTRVSWREKNRMLKVAFPTTLNPGAPARATHEIPYGHIERPAHWNTSWDKARFETPMQKWIDLSEGGYGVALLNDCKYGCDVKDAQLRLTLLRSARMPDPSADFGEHEFTYALLPHEGGFREAGVVREAYDLNVPLWTCLAPGSAGKRPARLALFEIDAENAIIETVKKAEENGDLIVRVYEAHNMRTRAAIRLPREAKRVAECNLVEREPKALAFNGNRIEFELSPFEIKTFRIAF